MFPERVIVLNANWLRPIVLNSEVGYDAMWGLPGCMSRREAIHR